ncbi:hypothetical protein LCGC14_1222370 [marine sediment metagenome]|uniref:Uncharacterized protein n=1 Tax=marine sediment metagenome TaxID=412755 RepID=A0A0F9LAZ1_9ZZZZ
MPFIVIPKRKMLRVQEAMAQPEPISEPSTIVTPPLILSSLLIDTSKNWAGFTISNLGAPADNTSAARKTDLDTAIEFIIDGSGSAITTGIKGDVRLPFAGTILSVALSASKESGSIVVDIWKDTYASFPPTDGDSITASAVPAISSDTDSQDSTLTGWTTSVSAGDVLAYYVDSVEGIHRVTVSAKCDRT